MIQRIRCFMNFHNHRDKGEIVLVNGELLRIKIFCYGCEKQIYYNESSDGSPVFEMVDWSTRKIEPSLKWREMK